MKRVIFACVHNAGRSQMAAAFFNSMANPLLAHALSAGTEPADHIHPEVITAMQEVGIDLSKARPQLLTEEIAGLADMLITMGCGDRCPAMPGLLRDDWPLGDPKGLSLENVGIIRDEIKKRVTNLLTENGWSL